MVKPLLYIEPSSSSLPSRPVAIAEIHACELFCNISNIFAKLNLCKCSEFLFLFVSILHVLLYRHWNRLPREVVDAPSNQSQIGWGVEQLDSSGRYTLSMSKGLELDEL